MDGTCFGTVIPSTDSLGDESFRNFYSKVTLSDSNKNGLDMLMYKEITDFNLGKKINDSKCEGCYLQNVNTNEQIQGQPIQFEPYYINDTNPNNPNPNFFVIRANISFPRYSYIADYLPLPIFLNNNVYQRQTGFIDITFGSTYFTSTAINNCYFSWALKNSNRHAFKPITQSNLFKVLNEAGDIISTNVISKETEVAKSTIEYVTYANSSGFANINFTSGSQNRIKSFLNNKTSIETNTLGDFKLFIDALENEEKVIQEGGRILQEDERDMFSINLFSSCFRISDNLSIIKSVYSFLEVIINWNTVSENRPNGETNRAIRFIKLYPEKDVFNCLENCTVSKFTKFANLYSFHFGISQYNATTTSSGVCLIEINNQLFNTEGNVLAFYLSGITLLDTDFTEVVSTYPVGPLVTANAFGINSGYVRSSLNPLSSNYFNKFSKYEENTTYHFFMSSVIYIQGYVQSRVTSSQVVQQNLFIPVYCPHEVVTESKHADIDMRISSIYYEMENSFNNISGLKKVISNTVNSKHYISFRFTKELYSKDVKAGTINFRSYSESGKSTENDVYLLSGNTRTLGAAKFTSTALILFYNNLVPQETNDDVILKYFLNDSEKSLTMTKAMNYLGSAGTSTFRFYVNGIIFNKMRFAVFPSEELLEVKSSTPTGSVNTAPPYVFDPNLSKITLLGIKRPNIEDYNSNLNLESLFETNSALISNLLSSNYINNINSPTSTINKISLNSNFGLGVANLIGFSAVSNDSKSSTIFTNFVVKETNRVLNYKLFLDDVFSDNTNWEVLISRERDGDFFKNDFSASLKFDLKPPGNLPIQTNIKITSNSFSRYTDCGIIQGNLIGIKCVNGVGNNVNTISCGINNGVSKNTKFTICCYNISSGNNPLIISGLNASYYKSKQADVDELVFVSKIQSKVLSNENTNLFVFDTKQTTAVSPAEVSTINAQITNVFFSASTHMGGMGVLWIKIDLPRTPLSDLKLMIDGDFRHLNLGDINPSCSFSYSDPILDPKFKTSGVFQNFSASLDLNTKFSTYGTEFEKGDFLNEGCSISGFNTQNGSIILLHKKIIYTCNVVPTNKVLYVKVFPVLIPDLSNENIKKITYKVRGELKSTNDQLLSTKNSYSFNTFQNLIPNKSYQETLTSGFQANTLCPSEINYKIAGDMGIQIAFMFDTDTKASILADYLSKKEIANEVSIWWNTSIFRISQNTFCRYKNLVIPCGIDQNGLMNITLTNTLEIRNKVDPIFVINVIANEVDAVTFPCSINYVTYNLSTLEVERKNLVIGSGKLKEGVNTRSTNADSNGSLNIRLVGTKNAIPKSFGELSVALYPESNKTLTGTPVFVIVLPNQFSNQYYQKNTVSVSIKEFEFDVDNITLKEKRINNNASIIVKSTEVVGNSIIAVVNSSSITFGNKFSHLELTVTSLLAPDNSIDIINTRNEVLFNEIPNKIIGGNLFLEYTDSIKVIVTNLSSSLIYRSFTSSNTFTSDEIITDSAILHNIQYFNGIKYSFGNSINRKTEIDFYSNDLITAQKNFIQVKSGRYSDIIVKVSQNSNSFISAVITMKQIFEESYNKLFLTEKSQYLITNLKYTQTISIGTSCSTQRGMYFIRFEYLKPEKKENVEEVNIYDTFYEMEAVRVFINQTPGDIVIYKSPNFIQDNIVTSQTVLEGSTNGGLILYYLLSDIVFETSIIEVINSSEEKANQVQFFPGVIYSNTKTGFTLLSNNSKEAEFQTFNLRLSKYDSEKYQPSENIPSNPIIDSLILEDVKLLGCFVPKAINVKITFTSAIAKLRIDSIKDSFAYLSSEDTINNINPNEIVFLYTPKYLKSYLFCTLTCFNNPFPTKAEIINNVQKKDTNKYQFKSLYTDVKATYQIRFSNLIREEQYKFKCYLRSPHSNQTEAEEREAEFIYFNNITNVNLTIKTNPLDFTTCITYFFKEVPDTMILENIRTRFQIEFISAGLNGCVTAHDSLNTTLFGFNLETVEGCSKRFTEDYYSNQNLKDILDSLEEQEYIESSGFIDTNNNSTTNNSTNNNNTSSNTTNSNNTITKNTTVRLSGDKRFLQNCDEEINDFTFKLDRNLQSSSEIENELKKQYTICGIQNNNCGTRLSKKYENIISEITNLSIKETDFKKNFAPSSSNTNFLRHTVFSDSTKPRIETITRNLLEFNSTYSLNIILTSPLSYNCFYRIQPRRLKIKPNLSEMLCNYNVNERMTFCGIIYSNNLGFRNYIQMRDKMLLPLNYEIYYVCFNKLKGAKNPSDIGLLGEFAFSPKGIICEENCTIDTNNTTSEVDVSFCDPDNSEIPCFTKNIEFFFGFIMLLLIITL